MKRGVAERLVDVGGGELGEDAADLVEVGVDFVVEMDEARDELLAAVAVARGGRASSVWAWARSGAA